MVHFTDADVERALAAGDVAAVLKEAFVELARGRAAQQMRVRTDAGAVKLSTMGAVVPAQGVAGAKVYTTVGGAFSFVIALFSTRTGRPLATFDANAITSVRTSAVSVLAARAAAPSRVAAIAVLGTGMQGRAHAAAFAAAYPRAQMRCVARNDDRARALAGAQIVVTATRSATPLFAGASIERGALVCAVGSSRPDTRELDDALLERCAAVIVEWKEQTLREAGDLVLAGAALRERLSVLELGDVLAGTVAPRSSDDDILVFKSVGVGIEDVAVAGLAYRKLTGAAP